MQFNLWSRVERYGLPVYFKWKGRLRILLSKRSLQPNFWTTTISRLL